MKMQTVFIVSLAITLIVLGLGIFNQPALEYYVETAYQGILEYFGWVYMLATFFFLVFAIGLSFSRFGQIKLGADHEKPQYSYFGWFSMLFAAGMGIGLIFWGVSEPLVHYLEPPAHIPEASGDAAGFAMRYSFFHWGLQPWAIYIIMSLSIAYFSFRRGMPPLISSCFYPMLGENIYKFPGYLIDILAVVATIFGVATSLGLGATQIHSGLSFLYGLPDGFNITLIIVIIATILYMISSVVGLDKGIQALSKLNMFIALILMVFMLIMGPTSYIFNIFTSTIGTYTNRLLEMSLDTNPFTGHEWIESWTLFYWAWWISWSPFVGLFVARISRGRTIKEFIHGVLLVPTLMTFLWFSVFGGAGFQLQLTEGIHIAEIAQQDASLALFHLFEAFPLGSILSSVTILLLFVFFITSADSATFVLGILSSNGTLNPSLAKKMTWGASQSGIALILLFTGGIQALQQMSITAALPFSIIMVLLCYNLLSALKEEV
ncbi:BCCT family transporter [Natranaerobius thermophilus]|uniref:Choline/carnitine/betaine transporter n=1 Tax=Natranaerobius thermophilus (strain ATCC BAA-1301 / DSM 18059 / JW/NM-WN-LF) TaxID=457570 RepID=B2A6S2_NATTJ|nr:BCCT family transporter [Natranaerobius thermophilus]ACB84203.1 choline/carnitine/betaine transporter [Natranaerobius thermophilus JW/NM-WN-LF]